MKTSRFATRVVIVPRDPSPWPGGHEIGFVTLSMTTDDGVEGIGYAGYVPTPMLAGLKAVLDALCEQALGQDPMDTEAIGANLLRLGGSGSPAGMVTRALAAIDVALWDIKGKILGQPLFKLLGGYRDHIPAYASGYLWRNFSLGALTETGQSLVSQGFRAMKFRMGGELTAAREIARMEALRQAVGDDIDLMVDINQGWSVNQAIAIGREMASYHIYWLEDPINFEDYEGLARIANTLDTPIATGEYHYGIAPFRHLLERRSLDVVMVDLLRVGGLTQWMKVAHMAEAFNLPVVSHLAPEVLGHAVAAVPNGLTVEHMPWAFPLFKHVPPVENGELVLSQVPGLGLEFDEEALTRFRAA